MKKLLYNEMIGVAVGDSLGISTTQGKHPARTGITPHGDEPRKEEEHPANPT